MYINSQYAPVAADAPGNGTSTSSNNTSTDTTGDMFMQLLVTQLQNQSPLDPVDPNQFVGQLVQFNTLDQISQIRQLLEQYAGAATPTAG